MDSILKPLITFFVLFLFSSQQSHAQWTKNKGEGYYKVSFWSLNYDQHFNQEGHIVDNPDRSFFNTNIYAEYGLSNTWNLKAYIPFFSKATTNVSIGTIADQNTSEESLNSIGDIDLGVTYGILNKNSWALSASLSLGIPTGDNADGLASSLQTGDGEFNQLLQVNLGKTFSIFGLNSYGKVYMGFNQRTRNFSDEFKTGLELGSALIDNSLWLIIRSDINESFQNGSRSNANAEGNIFANNIEYISLGAEAAYYITNTFGISLAYTSALRGRIIAANPVLSGGLFLDIK